MTETLRIASRSACSNAPGLIEVSFRDTAGDGLDSRILGDTEIYHVKTPTPYRSHDRRPVAVSDFAET